jgi:putative hydrolase of the HAD superfamily
MERKVIFWDFDGTLIYSNESFLCSLSDAFEQFNYLFEQKEIKDFLVSVCSWYVPSKEYTDRTGELWWQELLGKLQLFCGEHHIKKSDSDLICKKFRENVIRFEYKLYEDAEEILSYCKEEGYDNYILSNNFPELVETIKRFGLDKYITDYFLSSNIGYEKPRIEIFQYAVAKANNPECCYMVGDNPIADIQGGNEAGLQTILVHKADENACAKYVCKNLIDIKDLL